MPRRCSICANERLSEINAALVKGCYRQIARDFSVSEWATYRHRKDHLPVALSKAQEAVEVAEGDSLLDQLRQLHRRFLAILGKAEASGDLRTAIFAGREVRSDIELLAKMSNELGQGITLDVKVSSEWTSLRTAILRALERFPEARQGIVEALRDQG